MLFNSEGITPLPLCFECQYLSCLAVETAGWGRTAPLELGDRLEPGDRLNWTSWSQETDSSGLHGANIALANVA